MTMKTGVLADQNPAVAQMDQMEMTPASLRIANAAGEAIEAIMNASPQARVKRAIEWAALIECASEEARIEVANAIVGFARRAPEFLERGNYSGLDRILGEFDSAVIRAAQTTPPLPMPLPDLATYRRFGWNSEEADCLKTVLFTPMLGAARGDIVDSIDENGVRLSSGLSLSKGAIVAACQPARLAGR